MRVLCVPLGGTAGRDRAPQIILAALQLGAVFDSAPSFSEHTLALSADVRKQFSQISDALPMTEERTVLLGGSHALTLPAFVGFIRHHPGAGIIIFDAHPDALTTAQLSASGLQLPWEDLLRGLLERQLVPPERILLVGMRASTAEERAFLKEHKIRSFTMINILDLGITDFADALTETVNSWPAAYCSIDLDVLDPAFAPGVEAAVPGGLSSTDLFYILRRLALLKRLQVVDICELCPDLDPDGRTAAVAAEILRIFG